MLGLTGVRCGHALLLPQDDEYVVYSPDQVRLRYVVQFCMEGDRLKEFSPTFSTIAEPCLPSAVQGENCTPRGTTRVFLLQVIYHTCC